MTTSFQTNNVENVYIVSSNCEIEVNAYKISIGNLQQYKIEKFFSDAENLLEIHNYTVYGVIA